MWLPECGFTPGLQRPLNDAGIWCTVVEARAIAEASATVAFGNYAPLLSGDVAFFGRDPQSGAQVWSAEIGYPGDAAYREFHRDQVWEYEPHRTPGFVADDGARVPSGVKIHRVSGPDVDLGDKAPWDPQTAFSRARDHAAHFVSSRAAAVRQGSARADRPVHITCPYDAELFGHWWFEGPEFLRAVFDIAAEQQVFELSTPVDYLREGPVLQTAVPGVSTWGTNGDFSWWVDDSTSWLFPALHAAEVRWNQAGTQNAAATRELMLAQCSDWPFAVRGVTHAEYARARVLEHLRRFHALVDAG
jgi:1,4-alpha-glucan branching enzyme